MSQIQVITGFERRRRWSDAEKRPVVARAFAPGAVVTEVSRQLDINTGLIYRWRRELEEASAGFAEVRCLGAMFSARLNGVGGGALRLVSDPYFPIAEYTAMPYTHVHNDQANHSR